MNFISQILSSNLGSVIEVLGLLGWIIGGFFAVSGIFDRQSHMRRSENDQITNDLIKNQDKKIEQQLGMIDEMRATMEQHTKDRNEEISKLRENIAHLTGRNAVLEDLFKGRDPAQAKVFEQAPVIFEIAKQNNQMLAEIRIMVEGFAKQNSEALENLTNTINEFLKEIKDQKN